MRWLPKLCQSDVDVDKRDQDRYPSFSESLPTQAKEGNATDP